MLPLHPATTRVALGGMWLLAGFALLSYGGPSLRRNLSDNGNRWQNEDRVDAMVRELFQFDPTTVKFPKELNHAPVTKYAIKRQTILLPGSIMDPHPQNQVNGIVEGDESHFLHGCAATSGVIIDMSHTPWTMTSLDSEGNVKTHGGDEFYISYTLDNTADHSPDAVARIVDRADGTYELYFMQSRSPRRSLEPPADIIGVLNIHLLYTCAASFLDPPEKTNWKEDGSINAVWTEVGVRPPPFGWFKTAPRRFPEIATEYDFVLAVGNSLMRNFVWSCFAMDNIESGSCNNFMKRVRGKHITATLESRTGMRHNLVYSNGLGGPLNTNTVHSAFLPRIESGLEEQKESENRLGSIREDRSAFILGSCIWDLYAVYDLESFNQNGGNHRFGFYDGVDDHLEAIRILISETRRLHPLRKIYWKGCTAVHRQLHVTMPSYFNATTPDVARESVWYTSLIRGRHLDAAQKELLEELNVPVIDMFEITYEMPELHRDGDTKHYNAEMAILWADYFLPQGME